MLQIAIPMLPIQRGVAEVEELPLRARLDVEATGRRAAEAAEAALLSMATTRALAATAAMGSSW
jgi:hypothetical protein